MSNKIIRCDFQFRCPLKWDDLPKLENDKIRFCDVCRKDVHYAHNQNEFNDLAQQGKCVAVTTFEAENEVLTVTTKKVCEVCQTPITSNNTFCLNCGNLIVKIPDIPRVTMGLPALPSDIIKPPDNSPPKQEKPWWKIWK